MNVGGVMMWFSVLKNNERLLEDNVFDTFPEIQRLFGAYYQNAQLEVWPKISNKTMEKLHGDAAGLGRRLHAQQYWVKKDLKNMNVTLYVVLRSDYNNRIIIDDISVSIGTNKFDPENVWDVDGIVIFTDDVNDNYDDVLPKDDHALFGLDLVREWIKLLPKNYKVHINHTYGLNGLISAQDIKNGNFSVTKDGVIVPSNSRLQQHKANLNPLAKDGIMEIYNNSEVSS